jgi:hypothetical protein
MSRVTTTLLTHDIAMAHSREGCCGSLQFDIHGLFNNIILCGSHLYFRWLTLSGSGHVMRRISPAAGLERKNFKNRIRSFAGRARCAIDSGIDA